MRQTSEQLSSGGGHPLAARRTLRAIAAFEALKGVAVVVVMAGVVDLLHHDLHHQLFAMIGCFHLARDGHYASLLLHYAGALPGANLQLLLVLGGAYTLLRWVEAWGLWFDRAWAEWLAALSGGVYVPFELAHCMRHCTPVSAGVLVINLGIVFFMGWRLWRRRQAAPACPAA